MQLTYFKRETQTLSVIPVCIFGGRKSAFTITHQRGGKHWEKSASLSFITLVQYSLLQVQTSPLWCDKWFRVKVDINKWLIQELTRKSLRHQKELCTTMVWDTVLLGTLSLYEWHTITSEEICHSAFHNGTPRQC